MVIANLEGINFPSNCLDILSSWTQKASLKVDLIEYYWLYWCVKMQQGW